MVEACVACITSILVFAPASDRDQDRRARMAAWIAIDGQLHSRTSQADRISSTKTFGLNCPQFPVRLVRQRHFDNRIPDSSAAWRESGRHPIVIDNEDSTIRRRTICEFGSDMTAIAVVGCTARMGNRTTNSLPHPRPRLSASIFAVKFYHTSGRCSGRCPDPRVCERAGLRLGRTNKDAR